jgi:hypothetical protein
VVLRGEEASSVRHENSGKAPTRVRARSRTPQIRCRKKARMQGLG